MNAVRALGRTLAGRLIGVGLLAATGLLVGAQLTQLPAAGHAQLHASSAIGVLLLGGAIIARWPAAGPGSLAPAMACLLMGASQVIEGIGAFGYGVDGYHRLNGLASLHDLGLALAPIGLAAVVVGFGFAVAALTARWPGAGPQIAIPAGALFVVGGLVLVMKMIGLA